MRPRHIVPALALLAVASFAPCLLAAQQEPPPPKVEILQPAADQELTGAVPVHIKITATEGVALPSVAKAGLGGPPWVSLEKTDQPGEWEGQIESTLVPNGQQQLIVMTNNRKSKAEVQVTVNNPFKVFFAGLHSHTGYSDGTLTPADAHAYARDVAKLDVFCLTDHLEGIDDAEWLDTREVAWDYNEDGKFVVIPALEWTRRWAISISTTPRLAFGRKTQPRSTRPWHMQESLRSSTIRATGKRPTAGSPTRRLATGPYS